MQTALLILAASVIGTLTLIGIQKYIWWREDRAWAKRANAILSAAEKGVDVSFMFDRPGGV